MNGVGPFDRHAYFSWLSEQGGVATTQVAAGSPAIPFVFWSIASGAAALVLAVAGHALGLVG
jgi:hypothetical protein